MRAISNGFRITRASFALVLLTPRLLIYPLFSGLLAVPLLWGAGFVWQAGDVTIERAVLAGGFVYVAFVVAAFFQGALVASARATFRDEETTFARDLGAAASRLGTLATWVLLNLTVGLALRVVADRIPWVGAIVRAILGVIWSVLTFLVVPVIMFEDVGASEAVKRSGELFRRRWGEQLVGNFTIGLAIMISSLPFFAIAFGVGALSGPAGIGVGVFFLVLTLTINAAVTGMFQAVLYEYAATGWIPGIFTSTDLMTAFRSLKARKRLLGF